MAFILSVLVLGCTYAILAAGFVIIYKSSRVLNFAYADIGLVVAYSLVTMTQEMPFGHLLSIALCLLASFIGGFLIYQLLIRPMAGQPGSSLIIMTVAIGIVVQAVTILVWKCDTQSINFGWRKYYTITGNVRISSTEIVIIATSVIFYLCILAFYKYSRVGWQMRATAENVLLAARRGTNVHLIIGFSWAIGILATGIGSILLGAYSSVSLNMSHLAIKAFAVALVGGLDSVVGMFPAGLIVALAELGANYLVNPRLADAIPFIIILAVLTTRPWGLFGTQEEIERV